MILDMVARQLTVVPRRRINDRRVGSCAAADGNGHEDCWNSAHRWSPQLPTGFRHILVRAPLRQRRQVLHKLLKSSDRGNGPPSPNGCHCLTVMKGWLVGDRR